MGVKHSSKAVHHHCTSQLRTFRVPKDVLNDYSDEEPIRRFCLDREGIVSVTDLVRGAQWSPTQEPCSTPGCEGSDSPQASAQTGCSCTYLLNLVPTFQMLLQRYRASNYIIPEVHCKGHLCAMIMKYFVHVKQAILHCLHKSLIFEI